MVKLELSLRAKNLQNVAGVLKGTSDPFAAVVKIAMDSEEKPEVLGQTEVYVHSLDRLTGFTPPRVLSSRPLCS